MKLKIDKWRLKPHAVRLTDVEWDYLKDVRDLYDVKTRSEVLRIILSKEIDGFNHLLDKPLQSSKKEPGAQ